MPPGAKFKTCKDCLEEFGIAHDRWVTLHWDTPDLPEPKLPKRGANHPGPRCATHHRAFVKQSKAKLHENRVQKRYGLDEGDYQRLREFQGGLCAICQRAKGISKRLAVDHDHKTELVRGLLCSPCNQLLGHGRDSVEFFERIIRYLMHPPAKMLKIEARFTGERSK